DAPFAAEDCFKAGFREFRGGLQVLTIHVVLEVFRVIEGAADLDAGPAGCLLNPADLVTAAQVTEAGGGRLAGLGRLVGAVTARHLVRASASLPYQDLLDEGAAVLDAHSCDLPAHDLVDFSDDGRAFTFDAHTNITSCHTPPLPYSRPG